MLSYHNDPAVKAKYIARFEAHRAADEVIQGTGFANGRGCFVGCTLDNYDHSRFPVELGWPEWLARLADSIFEGLPEAEAPQFGTDLLASIPVGVDLEPALHLLAIKRLTILIELQKANKARHPSLSAMFDQTIAALALVLRCHESESGLNSCAVDWSAAESAARSAESAALSAAWSAESAAWSAARSAAWQTERDDLIEILKSLNTGA